MKHGDPMTDHQAFPNETELARALSEISGRDVNRQTPHLSPDQLGAFEDGAHSQVGLCPSLDDLRRFAAGRYGATSAQRDDVLAHLGTCDRCIDFMARLRKRRVLLRSAELALASAIVVAAILWIWTSQHHTPQNVNGAAIVDLRLLAPTRGTEPAPGRDALIIHRNIDRLRIILPLGSEGKYEVRIFAREREGDSALHTSRRTSLESREVVLDLPVNFGRVMPGSYLLALRRDEVDWEYYPLIIE
jgi:hypothetical protein